MLNKVKCSAGKGPLCSLVNTSPGQDLDLFRAGGVWLAKPLQQPVPQLSVYKMGAMTPTSLGKFSWIQLGREGKRQLLSTLPAMLCLEEVGCHGAIWPQFCTDLPSILTVLAPCLQPPLLAPQGSSAGLLPLWAASFRLCPEHLGGSCSHPALQDVTPLLAAYCLSPPCSQTSVSSLPTHPSQSHQPPLHSHITFFSFPGFISHNPAHGRTSKEGSPHHTILLSCPRTCTAHSFPAITCMWERKMGTRGARGHGHTPPADEGWQEPFSWQQCQHKVTAWTHLKPGSCLS